MTVRCHDGDLPASSLLLAVASPLLRDVLGSRGRLLLLPSATISGLRGLLALVSTGELACRAGSEAAEVAGLAELLGVQGVSVTRAPGEVVTREKARVQLEPCDGQEELVSASPKQESKSQLDQAETSAECPEQAVEESLLPRLDQACLGGGLLPRARGPVRKRVYRKKSRCHECQQCCKAFFSASQLEEHASRHEGRPGHCCHHCGKAFYRRDRLAVHTRAVHMGERNFPCSHCGKAFFDRHKLKCHVRIHDVCKSSRVLTKKNIASISVLKMESI
jgi:hypothetical protein